MFQLPDIIGMNATAASNERKLAIARECNLKRKSRKNPCECCEQPSEIHTPWFDIFSDDAKGVVHLCRACDENGRHHEDYFTCDHCDRLMVANYTWELYYKDNHDTGARVCLKCAAEEHFSDFGNLVDTSKLKEVVLDPKAESPLLVRNGVLNIGRAKHVLGVKQPCPEAVEFLDNWEFDNTSGRQISGGDMLADLRGIGGKVFIVMDSAYQFAVSIGAYRLKQ